MGVGGQRHGPVALLPVKTRYPLYRRLVGPHGRSGRVLKISPPPGFDSRTNRPVASRYTDWAIAAYNFNDLKRINECEPLLLSQIVIHTIYHKLSYTQFITNCHTHNLSQIVIHKIYHKLSYTKFITNCHTHNLSQIVIHIIYKWISFVRYKL
jgi:hypothetical protein